MHYSGGGVTPCNDTDCLKLQSESAINPEGLKLNTEFHRLCIADLVFLICHAAG